MSEQFLPDEDDDALVEMIATDIKPHFVTAGLVDMDADDYSWDAARDAVRATLRYIRETCEHEFHNRVSGGSLCEHCRLWQDKRV